MTPTPEYDMKYTIIITSLLSLALTVPAAPFALAAGRETAVAPEVSPPGDIPDNQAFITYKSPAGFLIKVPEGWARADKSDETIYADKYNHIAILVEQPEAPVDLAFAKSTLGPELEKNGRAVKITKISEVKLKAGKAIKIAFDSNSEPNSVTNKQVREENEAFYFTKDGKLVILRLSAPKGADNVDQWKLISSSFRWN
jgi:hypothetical protein